MNNSSPSIYKSLPSTEVSGEGEACWSDSPGSRRAQHAPKPAQDRVYLFKSHTNTPQIITIILFMFIMLSKPTVYIYIVE